MLCRTPSARCCGRYHRKLLLMLAADKLLLQSEVKQRAINLRERELKLFNSNFSAVGSQSAIMAGFTLTSFVEIDLPPERAFAKGVLHFFITASVCVNFICVAMVMFVTVWGSGKALRGLDGSMDYAVDSMNDERTFIFTCFALGVLSTLGCMFAAAWVLMEESIAMCASVFLLTTMYMVGTRAASDASQTPPRLLPPPGRPVPDAGRLPRNRRLSGSTTRR
uniref:Uncharacterized protein n=1 Tax=Emiliania huxleyi TaxID=2903 RepID=A0A7S3THF5_EMIHU